MPEFDLPHGLRVRTYDPAPADFDPLTASDRVLLHYGFPPRPGPQAPPGMLAQWERLLSRKFTQVVPTFSPVEGLLHRPYQLIETAGPDAQNPTTILASQNWAGSLLQIPNDNDQFLWISAEWQVPGITKDSSNQDTYAYQWIGFGGLKNGISDLFQIGTETNCIFAGMVDVSRIDCHLWWGMQGNMNKLATMEQGDTVTCILYRTPSSTGVDSLCSVFVQGTSFNTGDSWSISFSVPSPTDKPSTCAEWIVERPWMGSQYAPLANFDYVEFTQCQAVTWANDGTNYGVAQGLPIFMIEGSGDPFQGIGVRLAEPIFEDHQRMRVKWDQES